MELNLQTAELALREASESNPGAWADHSRFVAKACKNIASHCKDLSSEQAYICQVLPSMRYRENLFQNLEAILPCFRYKIQCYGYFSCLFTCTSGILYLLYGLNIREWLGNCQSIKIFTTSQIHNIHKVIFTTVHRMFIIN